ncbi:MAG: hypothetical protein JSW55_15900 [Chloroflexota bacterium]|nr:MAG: hypothetical protein JSW55_15900 [Chloroflexota bacterium]
MGFPEWTLWGMGLSVAGALIATTLAWLGQSPQLLRRVGLSGARLDLRVRAFTGYALALLLLAVAFFLAGVPLGTSPESEAIADQESGTVVSPAATATVSESADPGISPTPGESPTPATPETGAFSGPPAADDEPDSSSESPPLEPTETTEEVRPLTTTLEVATNQATAEPTSRPTETATPLPTETPLPSLTPTTIVDETAMVSTNGSTLWLKRSPGGQNVVLVRDGEIVIIRTGRANQGGILWREVTTVAGIDGWLQEEFLSAADS